MKILFTLCGRAGSKGIKGKNMRNFQGNPLALYSLSAIDLYLQRHPEHEGTTVLNTDSQLLREIVCDSSLAQQRPVMYVERREELAGDRVAKLDVLRDTLMVMEQRQAEQYDLLVDLDLTSPLRTITDIEHLVDKGSRMACDVVYSVTESRRNPYFNMVMKTERGYEKVIPSEFVSRQQAPVIYDMNASLYAYKTKAVRDGLDVFAEPAEIIEMLDTGVLDLDKPSDFDMMEVIGAWLFENNVEFREIRDNIR